VVLASTSTGHAWKEEFGSHVLFHVFFFNKHKGGDETMDFAESSYAANCLRASTYIYTVASSIGLAS
jgi:hypothetical protein